MVKGDRPWLFHLGFMVNDDHDGGFRWLMMVKLTVYDGFS